MMSIIYCVPNYCRRHCVASIGQTHKVLVSFELTKCSSPKLEEDDEISEETLNSDIQKLKEKRDMLDKEISQLVKEGYRVGELEDHIALLHEYNDIKDVAQMLLGKLATLLLEYCSPSSHQPLLPLGTQVCSSCFSAQNLKHRADLGASLNSVTIKLKGNLGGLHGRSPPREKATSCCGTQRTGLVMTEQRLQRKCNADNMLVDMSLFAFLVFGDRMSLYGLRHPSAGIRGMYRRANCDGQPSLSTQLDLGSP
ncbi:hypothetical protein NN561_002539 [Cricetulus griseus]